LACGGGHEEVSARGGAIPITREAFLLALAGGLATAAPRSKDLADFGVKGDGKADDAPPIQKAVDSGIGDLRFWRGTFRLTKPIVIELERVGRFRCEDRGRLW